MLCHRPGDRGSAFGDVKPVHLFASFHDPPQICKLPLVAQVLGMLEKEIAIQRNNDRCAVELILRGDIAAERKFRSFD